ncbi:MAG TPA: hypothetical protein VIL74_20725 [Pyrinomonadaceae bacterium]|jgi:hypothetical protein
MQFTNELVALATGAADPICKKELLRLVHRLRVKRAMTDAKKKSLVTQSLRSGALELEEIAGDCDFTPDEAERVLELLVEERKVSREARGGLQNRGRRMKFHYKLIFN